MTREHSGDGNDLALTESLAEALGELATGPEPPMPDLVSGAVVQGTRIRRRRRIGVALSSAAVAAAVAVGGYTVLTPTPQSRGPLPAAEPSVWYPSQALLRSILPASAGTVGTSQPRQPQPQPQPHFQLTGRKGVVSDLYVSVGRSTTGPPLPTPGSGKCVTALGHALMTPWGGTLTECRPRGASAGNSLLEYCVDKKSLPAFVGATRDPCARGVIYVTASGWTVHVLASTHDWSGEDLKGTTPTGLLLAELATDPRLFDAVEEPGG